MGIVNKLIPTYTKDKYGRVTITETAEPVYIDDAFDPFFNKKARAYLNQKYGNPLLGTVGGVAELIDNSLIGQKDRFGILGPGMGILSSFGRTMDKSGDILLGSLTEGVNALSHINPLGADSAVNNPIEQILVEDQDYTGNRLLAAMANNMSRLARDAKLEASDLSGMWNAPSTVIELATDPGILGGSLAKKFSPAVRGLNSSQILNQLGKSGVKSSVGEIGQLLSNYDDLMARVAIDMSAPGLRPMLKQTIDLINHNILGTSSADPYTDVVLNQMDETIPTGDMSTGNASTTVPPSLTYTVQQATSVSPPNPREQILKELERVKNNPNLDLYDKFLDDLTLKYNITSKTDPELFDKVYRLKELIYNSKNVPDADILKYIDNNKIKQAEYLKEYKESIKAQDARYLSDISKLTKTKAGKSLQTSKIWQSGSETSGYKKVYIKHRDALESFIDSLDGYSKGPGYEFDLGAYTKSNGKIDYNQFVEDLDNGYLKTIEGGSEVFLDESTTQSIAKKFDTVLERFGYDSPDVKVFISPTNRRVTQGNAAAKYINSRFAEVLLKHPSTRNLKSFDDILNYIKSDPDFIKYYNNLSNSSKSAFDKSLETIVKPSFTNKSGKNISNKITTYLKSTETFTQLIRRNFGGTVLETKPFYKDLIDFSDDIAKNIFEPLNLKYADEYAGGSTETMNYLSLHINPLLRYNKQAFRDASGNFDFDKFVEVYKAMPNLDVKLGKNVSKQVFTPSDKTDAVFDMIKSRIASKETYLFPKNFDKSKLPENVYEAIIDAVGYYDIKNWSDLKIQSVLSKLETNKKGIFYGQDLLRFIIGKSKQIFTPTVKTDRLFNMVITRLRNRNADIFPDYAKNIFKGMPEVRKAIQNAIDGYDPKVWTDLDIQNAINKLEQNKEGIFYGDDLKYFNVKNSNKYNKIPGVDSSIGIYKSLEKLHNEKLTNAVTNDFTNTVENIISKYEPEEIAKQVVVPQSPIQNVYENIKTDLLGDMSEANKIFGNTEETILKTGTPEEKRLFTLINKAEAVRPNVASGYTPTLRMQRVQNLISRFKELMAEQDINGKEIPSAGRFTTKQVQDYLILKDALNPVVTKKEDFLQDLITSRGLSLTVLPSNYKNLDSLKRAIENNMAVINSQGKEIIRGIFDKLPDGNIRIGYTFVPENLNIVKDINKLKIDTNRLMDIQWQYGRKHTADEAKRFASYQAIDDLFKESQEVTQDLSTQLGFTEFTEDYFKHTLSDNPKGADWLKNTLYKDIKIDDLSDLSDKMAQMLNLNKTFRIMPQTRSLKGNIARFNYAAPVFSTDLEAIVKSSFSKGVFDNSNFQSYVDLFVNDNFKIKDFAKSTEDLKRIFYSPEGAKYTGNVANLVLVAPKFKEGRLVGFQRFDKFSEKGLEAALANADTVLLPTNVLAPLDKILRKDAKMSNKAYAFINKYLTIPFKFGTLANPGFLAGNLSDAYYKQALSLSHKYGTSLTEELVNVAKSLRNVMILNNQFDDIYQKYIANITMNGKNVLPTHKISSNVIYSKKVKQDFINWLNDSASDILTSNERKKAQLFMWLNNRQNTSVFKSNVQDLEDLTDVVNTSKYDMPINPVQRILTGKGAYNSKKPSSWGLFANNPLSNKILSASESIESYMRSATVLNDLTHQYKGLDMMSILELSTKEESKVAEKLNIDMANAINLMHHANFDYENITNFMDAASTVIPFPTFFLKNLGYWLEVLLEHPQSIDHAISLQEGMWRDRDISQDEFEAEAKGRGAVPLDFGQKLPNWFKGIYKPSPLNSLFGAFNLINDPLPNLAYRFNPALSPITHHLQDAEDVKYRPYSTNIYEKNIKLGDKKFNNLKYLFHRLNPYERAINTALRTPAKVEKGQAQLSDFLPSIFQPDF